VKTQLLCTFAHRNNLDIVLEYIKQNFTIPEKRIFVFENANKQHELYCTYNAEDNGFRGKNTISIHRKKETNTLYTVNALNEIIVEQNNGVLDKRFPLYWPKYKNSFILNTNPGYKIVNLVFFTKISF
jgi:hypothetical protein